MEKEKLDEAKKFLEEDREKFEKLMNDSEKYAKSVADEVKMKQRIKQDLIKQKEEIESKIAQREATIKKHDDDLTVQKQHKHFLDILAMQAGKKKFNPRQPEGADPSGGILTGSKIDGPDSAAFITQVGG